MDAENRSDQQKNFDRWLDSALRVRMDAEPRTGLEERVLARLASDPQSTRASLWLRFAFAAAALAVVIGIALLRPSKTDSDLLTRRNQTGDHADANSRPSVPAISVPNQEAVASARIHRSRVGPRRVSAGRVVGHSESLPKLAAFPTPRPETEQERLLLRLASQPDVLQTAHLSSDLLLRELSIPPLSIPPMEGTPPDNSPLY